MENKCCGIFRSDAREYFLFGARFTFGFWLLYVGILKWLSGPEKFVGYITSAFAETWAPSSLLSPLAWCILCAEVVCGFWLLVGCAQRAAWSCTALLMFLLTFGQTMLKEHASVANNWQYFVLAMACAALSAPSGCRAGIKE